MKRAGYGHLPTRKRGGNGNLAITPISCITAISCCAAELPGRVGGRGWDRRRLSGGDTANWECANTLSATQEQQKPTQVPGSTFHIYKALRQTALDLCAVPQRVTTELLARQQVYACVGNVRDVDDEVCPSC